MQKVIKRVVNGKALRGTVIGIIPSGPPSPHLLELGQLDPDAPSELEPVDNVPAGHRLERPANEGNISLVQRAEWHTTANDGAQAARAKSVQHGTKRESRACLQRSWLYGLLYEAQQSPPAAWASAHQTTRPHNAGTV